MGALVQGTEAEQRGVNACGGWDRRGSSVPGEQRTGTLVAVVPNACMMTLAKLC